MAILDQLNEIEKQISALLGKQHTPIYFLETDSLIIAAGYIKEDKIIVINSKYQRITPTIISFIAHESRHAYQDQVVNGLIKPSMIDNVEDWHRELSSTLSPSSTDINAASFQEYCLQKIEIDALAFSELFIQKTIKNSIHLTIPDFLLNSVENRKKEIEAVIDFSLIHFKTLNQ